MPIPAGQEYELQDAVEIMFPSPLRRWSGKGNLTWNGQTFTQGGITESPSILTGGDSVYQVITVTLAAISQADRALFLGNDYGPVIGRIYKIFRKRTIGGVWSGWVQKALHEGRVSEAHYKEGLFSVEIKKASDDVPIKETVLWTNSFQQRRHPGDTCFARTDRIRTSGLAISFQT